MAQTERFPFVKGLKASCAVLKISPERVMRRAGLPLDLLENERRGITGEQLFATREATFAEIDSPDAVMEMAKAAVRSPFKPALLAFSCSPTIAIGLERLNTFKPLVAPVQIRTTREADRMVVDITSTMAHFPIPNSVCAFELVFFIELCRSYTADDVIPLRVALPGTHDNIGKLESFVGCPIDHGATLSFELALADADRRLLSEAEDLWPGFEKELRRQMMDWRGSQPTSARVKSALLELLPSGHATADAVCRELLMSKRSLYRHLARENITFQAILDETRTELSLHYLKNVEITVDEISYLLAYSDPNSFYRAFRNWTGMTPMQARERIAAGQMGSGDLPAAS